MSLEASEKQFTNVGLVGSWMLITWKPGAPHSAGRSSPWEPEPTAYAKPESSLITMLWTFVTLS